MSKEAAAWNSHAPMYERVLEHISIVFARNALVLANVASPKDKPLKLLDIACGPGRFAVLAAQQGFDVTAIDCSDRMVQFAQERADNAGVSIATRVVDGQTLDGLADNSFDVVTSHFGLTLFPDREQSFKSVLRVLKPGGRLILSSWGIDGFPVASAIYAAINAERKSTGQGQGQGNAPHGPPMNHPGRGIDRSTQDKSSHAASLEQEVTSRGLSETHVFTLHQDACFATCRDCIELLLDNVMGASAFLINGNDMESVKICMAHHIDLLNRGIHVNPVVADPTAPKPPKLADGVTPESMPIWNKPVVYPSSALVAIATKPVV